jgi:hypothetical protein
MLTVRAQRAGACPGAGRGKGQPMSEVRRPAPPRVEPLWNGKWPDEAEAEELVDERCSQRAIHARMTMLPALKVIALRDGSQAESGSRHHLLPIWKDRMDSRAWSRPRAPMSSTR